MVIISGLCSQTKKILRKIVCVRAAGCDKEETGCTTASAADTFNLQQVSNGMVSIGVPKLGPIDLIFIDAKVKINGAYTTVRCF